MLLCVDVPPLEDMSEELEKMKSLKSRKKGVKKPTNLSAPPQTDAALKTDAKDVKGIKKVQAKKEKSQTVKIKEKTVGSSVSSSFGGFKSGFLVSSSDSKPKVKRQTPSSKNASEDSDIPFIKPKNEGKSSLEFPEVQQAMKEAFPLLHTKGIVHAI